MSAGYAFSKIGVLAKPGDRMYLCLPLFHGTKFMLQQSENLTTEQSLMMNGMFTLMTSLKSNDLKESMSAFIEKRPPKYTGT